jgi:HNH endonuclease
MNCAICSGTRRLDRHHVVPKRMGGTKNSGIRGRTNLLTLCRRCHRNIHEGGWVLERSDTELRVTDRRTGMEVMRRLYRVGFDAGDFLGVFTRLDLFLTDAVRLIAFLEDEELVEAFRASRSLGRKAWLLQAAILYEAQRRGVYGEGLLEGIARKFEIGVRQAEKYSLVWRVFFASQDEPESSKEADQIVNVDEFFLDEPSWYIVAATESPEPRRWLAYAQDRKAENPRYSISDFRLDIQSTRTFAGSIAEPNAASLQRWWQCPWIEPFCTRYGRPIPVEECGCNQEGEVNDR